MKLTKTVMMLFMAIATLGAFSCSKENGSENANDTQSQNGGTPGNTSEGVALYEKLKTYIGRDIYEVKSEFESEGYMVRLNSEGKGADTNTLRLSCVMGTQNDYYGYTFSGKKDDNKIYSAQYTRGIDNLDTRKNETISMMDALAALHEMAYASEQYTFGGEILDKTSGSERIGSYLYYDEFRSAVLALDWSRRYEVSGGYYYNDLNLVNMIGFRTNEDNWTIGISPYHYN